MSVVNTIKFLEDASDVVVDAIGLAQSGMGWGAYGKAVALIGKVKNLVVEARDSMPELAHLDSEDALELGSAAYAAVSKIVNAA